MILMIAVECNKVSRTVNGKSPRENKADGGAWSVSSMKFNEIMNKFSETAEHRLWLPVKKLNP